MPTRKIFISYASQQRVVAESIAHAIPRERAKVFFDRNQLKSGNRYHDHLLRELRSSDLVIFLVSPDSVRHGRYTLTELEAAREKWETPHKHVLPVLVEPTPMADVPEYLKAVTLHETKGEIAGSVWRAVDRMLRVLPKGSKNGIRNVLVNRLDDNMSYAGAEFVLREDLEKAIKRRKRQPGGSVIRVDQLREDLDNCRPSRRPIEMNVSGIFFLGVLLAHGWWEKAKKPVAAEAAIKWKDRPLQRWFFSGFEDWAPSWDVTNWSTKAPFDLLGQIGTKDEADSVPVLIRSTEKAKNLRDDLAERVVSHATVHGLLCHQSHFTSMKHLHPIDRAALQELSDHFSTEYCLLVDDEVDYHGVNLSSGKVGHYSGYIWQCVAPREWTAAEAEKTAASNCYFVWEHTNFADRDVLRFGLDCLDNKVRLLQKHLRNTKDVSGKLVLLQHLTMDQRLRGEKGPLGEPAIPTEEFRNILGNRDEPEEG